MGIRNISKLIVGGVLPFNIADQVALPPFSLKNVHDLYAQYTAETNQPFTEEALEQLAKKLIKKGYPAYCEFHKPDEGRSFFRVRIGNYGSSAEADRILAEIRKLGYEGFSSQN